MKILFIACYSPLINNSASIETLQYLNNLVNEGNDIHLLTVDFPKNSIYYDEYILSMLNPKVKIHKVSGGKIFEKIMPKKSNNPIGSSSNTSKSYFKGLLKRGKKLIAIPDMYLNWARKASKIGLELMEKENFDVIFSMHEPPSSHICAMKIKEKNKDVPWVTYWSDPWLKDSTRENMGYIRRKIEGGFEKDIINLADRHIFVTKSNRDDYLNSYNIPKEKTFILTRGYDNHRKTKPIKMGQANDGNEDDLILLIACDNRFAIGNKGDMLFHIPDDLHHFKNTTMGHIVVMGRKTLESLPGGKPLPGRLNVVMTRQEREESENLRVVHDREALEALLAEENPDGTRKVFHVGGGGLVKSLWDLIDEAILTRVDATFPEADTWIPDFDASEEFQLVDKGKSGEYKDLHWQIYHYKRIAEKNRKEAEKDHGVPQQAQHAVGKEKNADER